MSDEIKETLDEFMDAILKSDPDDDSDNTPPQPNPAVQSFTMADLKGWEKFVDKLHTVASKAELQGWLQGKLFKRFFEYYINFHVPHQITTPNMKGQDLKSIIKRVEVAKRDDDPKYTTEVDPETAEWTAADWAARLVGGVVFDNTTMKQGLFYGSPLNRRNASWSCGRLSKGFTNLSLHPKSARALEGSTC